VAINPTAVDRAAAARKVLLVGATGFLGSKILRHLQQEPTFSVRAMSRREAPISPGRAVEWVRADMMDPSSLDAALHGVDVVVTSANGYMKESIETDFQGNTNLIEAALRAGVQRLVFLSIVACEAAPEVPHFHAKKVAEDLIKSSGLPFVLCARRPSSTKAVTMSSKAQRPGGSMRWATRPPSGRTSSRMTLLSASRRRRRIRARKSRTKRSTSAGETA
jgi:hypothetical protein